MDFNFKNLNPRDVLKSWEAQAFALLTTKGYPTSFKGVSELMNDSSISADCSRALQIVFWGRVWKQAKTKEEVTTAWNNILSAIKHSNFQSSADYADGKLADVVDVSDANEVTVPIVERIAELKAEGLTIPQVIERGFKKEAVKKVFLAN